MSDRATFLQKARALLWSADTQAWRMNRTGRRRFAHTQVEKLQNFSEYHRDVSRIMARDVDQCTLGGIA